MSYGAVSKPSRSAARLWGIGVILFLMLGGMAAIAVFNGVRNTVRDLHFNLPRG